jgi:hypothetical protein
MNALGPHSNVQAAQQKVFQSFRCAMTLVLILKAAFTELQNARTTANYYSFSISDLFHIEKLLQHSLAV